VEVEAIIPNNGDRDFRAAASGGSRAGCRATGRHAARGSPAPVRVRAPTAASSFSWAHSQAIQRAKFVPHLANQLGR